MDLIKANKTKSITKGWMTVPVVFTFSALAPEYVAPFLLVFSVIYTIKNKKISKKSFGSFSIGYSLLLYIGWMMVGVFYANSTISALASVGLWLLMFSGMWFCGEWVDNAEKMERVILGGAFAVGINGFIGILQAGVRLVFPEHHNIINPFWHFLDLLIEKIVSLLPEFITSNMARTTFTVSERACGTFSNPLFFATFQVAMIPFAVYCFLNCKNKNHRIMGLVSLLLALGGIVFSFSRGPYIVTIIVFLLLMLYGGKRALKVLGIGLGCGAVVLAVSGDLIVSRLLTLLNANDVSINTRMGLLGAILEKIPQEFVFGYGTGFDSVRSILHNEYNIMQPHAHNILLEIQMENGIIGVALFFLMCLVFLYNILRLRKKGETARNFAITLFVSFVAMCLCGMTDCIFYGFKPLQYMLMILGLTQACVNIFFKEGELFHAKRNNTEPDKEKELATMQ